MSSVAKSSVSINENIFFYYYAISDAQRMPEKAAAKYISPRWLHPKLTRSLVWIWGIYTSVLVLESNLVILRRKGINCINRICTSGMRALNLEGFKNTACLDLKLASVSLMSSLEKQQFVLREEDETCFLLADCAESPRSVFTKYKCKAIKIAALNPILWLFYES